jgi:archaetidylinositol phosphate synthase
MDNKKSHKRVNDILLGPLERPALAWLAARLPKWVTPDILTGLGLLAGILIALSYWLTNYNNIFLWLASFGFFLNWFGDSLDGTVARFRKIERPRYGFFIDHNMDAITSILVFWGLGLSPYVDFKIAMLGLSSYMLLAVFVYVLTYATGVFRISSSKIGPTEIRAISVLANTIIYFVGNLKIGFLFGTYTLYSLIVFGVAIMLFGLFIINVVQEARNLLQAEEKGKT